MKYYWPGDRGEIPSEPCMSCGEPVDITMGPAVGAVPVIASSRDLAERPEEFEKYTLVFCFECGTNIPLMFELGVMRVVGHIVPELDVAGDLET